MKNIDIFSQVEYFLIIIDVIPDIPRKSIICWKNIIKLRYIILNLKFVR